MGGISKSMSTQPRYSTTRVAHLDSSKLLLLKNCISNLYSGGNDLLLLAAVPTPVEADRLDPLVLVLFHLGVDLECELAGRREDEDVWAAALLPRQWLQ